MKDRVRKKKVRNTKYMGKDDPKFKEYLKQNLAKSWKLIFDIVLYIETIFFSISSPKNYRLKDVKQNVSFYRDLNVIL